MFSRANNGRSGQSGPVAVPSNSSAAGNRSRSEKFKPPGQPARPADTTPAKQTVGFNVAPAQNERLLYALLLLVGRKIEVQVKSGAVYEGVLYTTSLEPKDLHIVLKLPKLVKEPAGKMTDRHKLAEKPPAKLVIYSNELVGFVAHDVEERWRGEDALETDGDISRGKAGIVGRELQPWIPDAEDGFDMGLETAGDYAPGWDQFAVNQQMFGVHSTWDEGLYTTVLDKSKSKITESAAEAIAREIERGSALLNNLHVLEERGFEVDDSGIDEEDKYSSVLRDSYGGPPAPAPAERRSSGSSVRPSQNGGSKLPAWSSHGAGVAAVAGRQADNNIHPQQLPPTHQAQSGQPQQPGVGTLSAPIDIDIRKETNRIRSQLAGPKKTSSSPAHGTPKGLKSPLISPLINNPELVEALNLDPGQTKVEPEVVKEFMEFKLKARQDKAEQTKKEMQELKASAERIRLPAKPDDRVGFTGFDGTTPPSTPGVRGDSGSTTTGLTPDRAGPAASKDLRRDGAKDEKADSSADRKADAESKLKPASTSFKFNINAKEFVPGGTPPPSATKPAPPAAPPPVVSKPVVIAPPPVTPPVSTTATPVPKPPPREREPPSAPSTSSDKPSATPAATPPAPAAPPTSSSISHKDSSHHHNTASSTPSSSSKFDSRSEHGFHTPGSMSMSSSQGRDGPSFQPSIALSPGALHHPHMTPMPGQFPGGYMGYGHTMPGSMLSPGLMTPVMASGPIGFPPMARMAGPHSGPYAYSAFVPGYHHQFSMGPGPAARGMYGGPGIPFAMSPSMAMSPAGAMSPHDRPHSGRGRQHRHNSSAGGGGNSGGHSGPGGSGGMRNDQEREYPMNKDHMNKPYQQSKEGPSRGPSGNDD